MREDLIQPLWLQDSKTATYNRRKFNKSTYCRLCRQDTLDGISTVCTIAIIKIEYKNPQDEQAVQGTPPCFLQGLLKHMTTIEDCKSIVGNIEAYNPDMPNFVLCFTKYNGFYNVPCKYYGYILLMYYNL